MADENTMLEMLNKKDDDNLLAQALLPALTTLGGYLGGGYQGGAAGAEAGMKGLDVYNQGVRQQKKDEMEAAELYGKYGIKKGDGQYAIDPNSPAQLAKAEEKAMKQLQKTQMELNIAESYKKEPAKKFEAETELRKERNQLPTTKDTQTIASAYGKLNSVASKAPSAAGDMSLVFSFMRIQDPNSTVREGEFATAENARGVSESVRNLYNKLQKGERLTEEQRADFLNQSKNLYESQLELQKSTDRQYEELARSRGINPKAVLTEFQVQSKPAYKKVDQNIDAKLKRIQELEAKAKAGAK